MPQKNSTQDLKHDLPHLIQLRHLRQSIGRQLQKARHRKRMTLKDLAARSNIGVNTLDKLELGYKVIDLEMITHIARVLDAPLSAIIKLEKAKEKK